MTAFRTIGLTWDDEIPHRVIAAVLQSAWKYALVCSFFRGVVHDSATAVCGQANTDYGWLDALNIVGHFNQNWHGCPNENCPGDPEAG